MTAYSGYGNSIRLRSAEKLVVYHADNGRVVIIEYEVHGKAMGTDRKIVHWRDYMRLSGCVERPEPAALLMSMSF